MSKAGVPGEPSPRRDSLDDIPEALRDTPVLGAQRSSSRRGSFIQWALIGLAIAFVAGLITSLSLPPRTSASSAVPLQTGIQAAFRQVGVPLVDDSLLGHLPYEVAPEDELQTLSGHNGVRLRRSAAQRFLAMADAARADGVYLQAGSGFRTIEDQQRLFFDLKAQRGQRAAERAEVSAPPGYSEHHTGYAVDILDANRSDTNLSVSFEQTPAFQWLQENSARYSFELSFPRDNPRGISYEPWHWRFVGDRHSLETFYKARSNWAVRN